MEISNEVKEAALLYLKQNRKIDAIKQVRAMTGLGLKEAKDMVDLIQEENYQTLYEDQHQQPPKREKALATELAETWATYLQKIDASLVAILSNQSEILTNQRSLADAFNRMQVLDTKIFEAQEKVTQEMFLFVQGLTKRIEGLEKKGRKSGKSNKKPSRKEKPASKRTVAGKKEAR